MISADEKSQLQALHRRHEDLPPGPGRTRQVEFEYKRGGTLAYLTALDVHHATVMGRCASSQQPALTVIKSRQHRRQLRHQQLVTTGRRHTANLELRPRSGGTPNYTIVIRYVVIIQSEFLGQSWSTAPQATRPDHRTRGFALRRAVPTARPGPSRHGSGKTPKARPLRAPPGCTPGPAPANAAGPRPGRSRCSVCRTAHNDAGSPTGAREPQADARPRRTRSSRCRPARSDQPSP